MCHDNSNVETLMTELESATEHLSNVQERINRPLFDLLFKLVNTPQTTSLAGSKLKVLHTYAHRFMEFYMTGCPDGVSTPTMSADAIYEVANTLRSLGDGLARLLDYLGMAMDSEHLTEYVDVLAVAYDTVGAVLAQVAICDDECQCDCCECDGCDCGHEADETSWVNECREDDDAAEYDPEDESCEYGSCSKCTSEEALERLLKEIFGAEPRDTTPKEKPSVKQEKPQAPDVDPLTKEMAQLLARMLGLKDCGITVKHFNEKSKAVQENAVKQTAADNTVKPQIRRIVVREVVPGFWRFG